MDTRGAQQLCSRFSVASVDASDVFSVAVARSCRLGIPAGDGPSRASLSQAPSKLTQISEDKLCMLKLQAGSCEPVPMAVKLQRGRTEESWVLGAGPCKEHYSQSVYCWSWANSAGLSVIQPPSLILGPLRGHRPPL